MYKLLLRPLLFIFAPETAHKISFRMLGAVQRFGWTGLLTALWPVRRRPTATVEAFGLRFRNPLGLAAGFDKDAQLLKIWDALGFGFVEVGTVTPRPQPGNPLPRLFRLVPDRGLINRMGFNNQGVKAMEDRLKAFRHQHPDSQLIIGGNIGKNKDTPNEEAAADYLCCMESLYPWVDFFAVNVSSPNTPGLRQLQGKEPLMALLQAIRKAGLELAYEHQVPERPVLLKIAPDLTGEEVNDVVQVVKEAGIHGLIATNTTLSREGLISDIDQAGGLSGAPLKDRSTELIRRIRQLAGDEFTVVGVGGIMSGEDAREKVRAGANLVQIYTGFVYEGPSLVAGITEALADNNRSEA